MITPTTIRIETTIHASPEQVWNMYTSPEHITQWNFASDDWQCPHATNDLVKGGRYVARMEAKDGSFAFDFEAVYDEVQMHKKLVYTLGDNRKVEVNFEPHHGDTTVIVKFVAENQNPVEMQEQGWLAILTNFKKYVERSV